MIVCEVGCWKGESTRSYAPIVKDNNGHIYVVDWFCGNTGAGEGPHGYKPKNADDIEIQFRNNLMDYCSIITILRGHSVEMAKYIHDESLDICYIDGDHKYTNVKNDIQNYLPKVKKGGILAGHDCENLTWANSFRPRELELDWLYSRRCHPGVIQAVHDLFGPFCEIIQDPPHNTWIKRL